MTHAGPIGIFDSGIGGLTVTASIQQALPTERLLYFGDTLHVPYGPRSLDEVRSFSFAITESLLARGSKAIVIACNTASAAALQALREAYADIPFVGMEPAVKPAVEQTRSGVVGVIATVATFQSALYNTIVERFAKGVTVLRQPCPGLVRQIEDGAFDTTETEAMLRGWLEPMLDEGIDALVLGCTHYPIVRPLIERIVGPNVRVIDPAPAIARQLDRILDRDGLRSAETTGSTRYFTSGDPSGFDRVLQRLGMNAGLVEHAEWDNSGSLTLP